LGFDIRPATTPADFRDLHALITRMAVWDAEQPRAAGFPPEAVRDAYYRNSPEDLFGMLTAPGAIMLLARDGDDTIGCLGYAPLSAGVAEQEKFCVLDSARGRGVGGQLLDALLPRLRADGYRRAYLETGFFMTKALALYAHAGFRPCPPLRPPPPGLEGLNVFLDRSL
jgi:GNAT superfamily N-acetyltransferase